MFDKKGRKSLVIFDSSLHSRRIISVLRRTALTAEEGYAEWKYRVIDGIFSICKEFQADEVILALDQKPYWRRDIFEYYKATRKLQRDKDEEKNLDWFKYDEYFEKYDALVEDIKNNLPFKIISIPRTEADDIAAVLSHWYELREWNKIIVTNDSDYIQLLMAPNVYLYNPLKREFMVSDDPKKELILKICLGDDSDYIPSIQNTEIYKDTFLDYCVKDLGVATTEQNAKIKLDENEKLFYESSLQFQKTYGLKGSTSRKIPKKLVLEHINNSTLHDYLKEPENTELKKRFVRNNKLINLQQQPEDIKMKIINAYKDYGKLPELRGVFNYFVKSKFNGFVNDMTKIEQILLPLAKV